MDLAQTLAKVQKTLSTPAYVNPGTLTLVRENLSAFITKLPYTETPLRDRLARKQGSGLAASWNVLTAIGTGNSPFAEGGTPTEDDATYVRRSAPYKELGKKKSITDRMLAAGASFKDLEAELTETAMREVLQDEETLIIQGDINVSALQFDGLGVLITTNTIDDANNALGFRTDLLDQAIQTLMENYGVKPTAIYCNYGMKRAINQSLAGDVRVPLTSGNNVDVGVDVGFYQSMVGKLPIVATPAIPNDSATYAGFTVSDIYVVTEKWAGQDNIYMEDLYPLGKANLDRTGAAMNFMVTECTVLVCRSEELNVKIENVRIS